MTELGPLFPADEHNRELERQVHPPDWQNPIPDGRYNLVVLGAGTAGLVTAAGAAGLGAKVALIERDLMGGDCLNVGCVPSKAIISAGRVAETVRTADRFGIRLPGPIDVDFAAAMERMRKLRAGIAPNDSAERFRGLGVDVYLGEGRFTSRSTIRVGESELRFRKAVIATGARAAAPPISGLDQVGYLTNETVFSLTERPERIGVIGAGPIGCELAQTFAQLGSEVFLVESTHGILPREDREAAQIVEGAIGRSGVQLLCCGRNLELSPGRTRPVRLRVESHEAGYDEEVDRLLVAVGRAPNVSGIGLETAGVAFDEQNGVVVDDFLRTTNPHILSAGDVCSRFKFTHAADFLARCAIQNALFPKKARASSLLIPWCTYTSPEIAHVGLHPSEGETRNTPVDTYVQELADVDRAILEGDDAGFVKVHTAKGKSTILGATIVARNAGDLISEITVAMQHGLGLGKIARTIHPYPTQAEAIRRIGDQYNRTRLKPGIRSLMEKWFRFCR